MNGTRTKIEVSDYGRRVNQAIRAEMTRRGLSNHKLAAQISRSDKYVRDRTNGDKEWALADIERICQAWDADPARITAYATLRPAETTADPQNSQTVTINRLTDAQIVRIVMTKLSNGDLSLVANHDPHKKDEMEGGDGR